MSSKEQCDSIVFALGKMAYKLGEWAMTDYKGRDPEYLQACVDLMKEGSRMIAKSSAREVEDLTITMGGSSNGR